MLEREVKKKMPDCKVIAVVNQKGTRKKIQLHALL